MTTDARAWRQAVAVTVVAAVARLAVAALIPLVPDETYYWDWSRHLQAGYFDHPPAIALLIAAGTRLLRSDSAFAIRLFPVLAGFVAALASAGIARRLAGDAAARLAALAFALMPLSAAGLVLATPDAPLLAACALSLYGVVRALESPVRSRASLLWWSGAGLALGVAFASKYTSILLPLTIVAAIASRRSLRARLTEPGPYVACLLATMVFAPVLYWNATHDWASFRFQLQHGLGTPRGSPLKRELELLGGQLGLVSPIIFALAAHAVWRALRQNASDVRWLLALVAAGCWLFFVYSALRKPVEANWPALSYVPAIALFAAHHAGHSIRWPRRALVLAGAFTLLLFGVVGVVASGARVPAFAARAAVRAARELASWDGVAGAVARVAGPGRRWVAADRYQDVSKLAHVLPGRPDVLCLCLAGRRNQYELWPAFAERAHRGDSLVVVLEEVGEEHPAVQRLSPYFSSIQRGPLAAVVRGADTVALRRVWLLDDYRGGWPMRAAP